MSISISYQNFHKNFQTCLIVFPSCRHAFLLSKNSIHCYRIARHTIEMNILRISLYTKCTHALNCNCNKNKLEARKSILRRKKNAKTKQERRRHTPSGFHIKFFPPAHTVFDQFVTLAFVGCLVRQKFFFFFRTN